MHFPDKEVKFYNDTTYSTPNLMFPDFSLDRIMTVK